MQFGLCTISAADRPVEAVLDLAAEAGYDGVEFWGKDHVGDGSAATCRRLSHLADDRGLSVPVYGSYLRPGTASYETERDRELAIARRLGADLIRVWAGDQEYEDRDDRHWERVVSDLVDLADRASDLGLAVTVEKHEGTLTNTTAGARRLIEAVDHEHCGLNWQPLFALSADALADEAAELAPLCNNVHLQAAPERGAERRCRLEGAYFDVGRTLEPFVERGFDGFANVEFVDPDLGYEDAIAADLEYLRSVV